ncbi:hypothetical protein BDW62DRAFT_188596 [Aspergillus aurantiobrunneus]
MPNPTTLPPELFTQIITSALQPGSPTDIEREYDFHSGTNISSSQHSTPDTRATGIHRSGGSYEWSYRIRESRSWCAR